MCHVELSWHLVHYELFVFDHCLDPQSRCLQVSYLSPSPLRDANLCRAVAPQSQVGDVAHVTCQSTNPRSARTVNHSVEFRFAGRKHDWNLRRARSQQCARPQSILTYLHDLCQTLTSDASHCPRRRHERTSLHASTTLRVTSLGNSSISRSPSQQTASLACPPLVSETASVLHDEDLRQNLQHSGYHGVRQTRCRFKDGRRSQASSRRTRMD